MLFVGIYGFNHPMVKVKESHIESVEILYQSFNHPMVKVKASYET